MDFGLVRDLVRSNSASAASNNGVTLASETDADANNLRLYGSGFLHKVKTSAEDDLHPAKAARISSLRECNDGGVSTQKMLSFSSPNSQLLSFSPHNASIAAFPFVSNSSGYCCGGLSGPFTPSQWMELEHQALIYKYITANVPIPSYLLIPIRKALESSGLSRFSLLKPNALRWNGFHLGFSKTDPEPGRCRRTDGKKWRCSREAVADQKYCERHMNRGRHRSRKPVEGELAVRGASLLHQHQPTNIRNHGDERKSETSMEATVGVPLEHNPISVGGPLGEALSIGTKALDLMEDRSPLGVLSKTIDGVSICNGFVVPGLVLPTLPAL